MDFFKDILEDTEIIIYTDGACSGNPGTGGWGAVIKHGDKTHDIYGGEEHTTNNRMELKACLEALKFTPEKFLVVVRTDSKYVKDGITIWLKNWKKNGWKTASNKPVKNRDLWQELDSLSSIRKVTWEWVPAHKGEENNERADMLAKQGIVSIRLKS